jgi:hypothetical protein
MMTKKKSAKRKRIVLDPSDEYSMAKIEETLDETFGDISEMARRLGIARRLFYKKNETDPIFKERFYKAVDRGLDRAKDLLIHRVIEGTPKWVFRGKRRVKIEQVPDNGLLLNLVRSRHPEFRSTSNVNVRASADGPPIRDENLDAFVLTEEGNRIAHKMLEKYERYLEKKGLIPPSEEVPALPAPEEDPEKLEKRDGLHVVKSEDEDDGGDRY